MKVLANITRHDLIGMHQSISGKDSGLDPLLLLLKSSGQ